MTLELNADDLAVWSAALDDLEGVPHGNAAVRARALGRWATPGDVAVELVPSTVQTPMLGLLDKAIVRADSGEQRRWVINTPPQEGKSTRICRDAALWLLLRNPNRRIVIASYQQNLAEVSTLGVRQLIEMYGSRPGYLDEDNRLGLSIDPSKAAAGNWRLAGHAGGMVAVGIGSGTTGRPGDVIVVDDPLPDAEAADSPVQRRKVIDWWTSVIQTRLVATSIVIVVQTRWAEEDLSGWLIENNDAGTSAGGHRYEVLSVPAQAEADDPLGRAPGEWLESARGRTVSEWETTQAEIVKGGVRWWFALFQQRPAPPSGDTFKLEWFDQDRVWERPAAGVPPVVVIDPADNPGTGDEAGILVASQDTAGDIYLGPDYSGHYTVARWVRVALLAVARHTATQLVYEQSLSGLATDVTDGWTALRKQALILRRLGATETLNPDVVERAVGELCTAEDTDTTRGKYRTELLELWPLVSAVLDLPKEGPSVRRIIPKGTKVWRAQSASPRYEHRRVHHVGALSVLEHQMSTWQPGQKSPDRMDACLRRGSLVLTSRGEVAIESIRVGDDVWTRAGWRAVTAAWMTQRDACVWDVHLSNGRVLTGTPDHRVWTQRGWLSIDELVHGDTLSGWTNHPSLWCIEVSPTAGTLTETSELTVSTMRHREGWNPDRFTGPSGSMNTRANGSHRDGISTTTTTTRSTTPLTTSSSGLPLSMPRITPRKCGNGEEKISTNKDHSLQSGIRARLVERGTKSTGNRPGNNGNRNTSEFALPAVINSSRISLMRCDAPGRVINVHTGLAWSDRNALSARSVSQSSGGKNEPTQPRPVPVVVEHVCVADEPADVYDLTVADEHEFVASGVVVHNCVHAVMLLSGMSAAELVKTKGQLPTRSTRSTRTRNPVLPRSTMVRR